MSKSVAATSDMVSFPGINEGEVLTLCARFGRVGFGEGDDRRLPARRSSPSPKTTRPNRAQSVNTSPSFIPGNETMSLVAATDFDIAPARPLVPPLVLAALCVALADWLFYGWQAGISLALFLGVLGCVAVYSNRVHAMKTRM